MSKNKKLTPLQKTRQTQVAVKKYIRDVLQPLIFKDIEDKFKLELDEAFYLTEDEDILNQVLNKYIKK